MLGAIGLGAGAVRRIGVLVVPVAIAVMLASCTGTAPARRDPSSPVASAVPSAPQASGSQRPAVTQGPPPWALPADVTAAIRSAGLEPLTAEGEVQHTHSELQLWYDGKRVIVPADIGIDQAAGTLSPIHTHDASGIIHVESPVVATFRLGQFFAEWRVSLAGARAWVNGQPASDPAGIVLVDHQMIVVAWGTPPDPVPATYTEGYYPGDRIPDLVPTVTLHGLPSGFDASGVTERFNGVFPYLAELDASAASRERPLVEGTLQAFQVKEWTLQGQATLDLFTWQFADAAAAQRYSASSGQFVGGDAQAVPSVAGDARVWYGPDPQRTDGSIVGQVSWSSGSRAYVLLAAAARGVLPREQLVSRAESAARAASTIAGASPSPAASSVP